MPPGRLPLLASCFLLPAFAKCQDKGATVIVLVTATQHDGKNFYKPLQLRYLQFSVEDGVGFFSLNSPRLSFISNIRRGEQPETLLTLRRTSGSLSNAPAQISEQPTPLWSNYSDIDGDTIFDTMSQVFPKNDIRSFILFENTWIPVVPKKTAATESSMVFGDSGRYIFEGRQWRKLLAENSNSPRSSK